MSLRESLDVAYDKIDAAPTEPIEAPAATPEAVPAAPDESTTSLTEPQIESVPEKARDDTGRFAKAVKSATRRPAPGSKTGTPLPQAEPTPSSTPTPVTAAAVRAPQSLKPVSREQWAKLPAEFDSLKQDFDRREREHQKVIQENAQLRQTSQAGNPFQEEIRPYEATIRASGLEPHKYVGSILQQVHALSYGPPHVKADVLAGIVAQFGSDLIQPNGQDGLSPLDRALAAKFSGRPTQQAPHSQYQDPRVDKLLGALEQRSKQQAQAAETEASERLESIASNPEFEFFGDVATAMGDIFDVWERQGKKQVSDDDVKRAYHLACQMNPDVAPVYEQRKAAEAARKAQASTERARIASSSPRSHPTDAPTAKPRGLRATLETAWDDIASR